MHGILMPRCAQPQSSAHFLFDSAAQLRAPLFFVTLLLLATERPLREERGAWIGVLLASVLTVLANPLGMIWVFANPMVLAAVAIFRGKWR